MSEKILSFDGGGIFGLVALQTFKAIEIETGKQLPDIFTLLSGTSTASLIVASAVAGRDKSRKFARPVEARKKRPLDFGEEVFTATDSGAIQINELPIIPRFKIVSIDSS